MIWSPAATFLGYGDLVLSGDFRVRTGQRAIHGLAGEPEQLDDRANGVVAGIAHPPDLAILGRGDGGLAPAQLARHVDNAAARIAERED